MRYLNLDLEVLQAWEGLKPAHLVIFGYIKRLCESRSTKVERRRLPGDSTYTWVDLATMQEALPCLRIGYDALRNAVDALAEATDSKGEHLIERHTRLLKTGRAAYFRVSKAYFDREAELDRLTEKAPHGESHPEKTPVGHAEKTPDAHPEKTPEYRKSIDPEKRTEKEGGEDAIASLAPPGLENTGTEKPDRTGTENTGTVKPYILNTELQNSAGVPARQPSASPAKRKETPQGRLVALFFELYRNRTGKEPPWTRGKDHALLGADLRRLGVDRLTAAVRLFFDSPPRSVADFIIKAGCSYGVLHSQLPKLEELLGKEERRLRLLKTCLACGKASETTGIDCPKCGEPDAFKAREAVNA